MKRCLNLFGFGDNNSENSVVAVSKLIPGRFVPVISDFDSCWLDGISCGASQMADLLSSLIEVNREYLEGMLLDYVIGIWQKLEEISR